MTQGMEDYREVAVKVTVFGEEVNSTLDTMNSSVSTDSKWFQEKEEYCRPPKEGHELLMIDESKSQEKVQSRYRCGDYGFRKIVYLAHSQISCGWDVCSSQKKLLLNLKTHTAWINSLERESWVL